jgi:hypothetical protein
MGRLRKDRHGKARQGLGLGMEIQGKERNCKEKHHMSSQVKGRHAKARHRNERKGKT